MSCSIAHRWRRLAKEKFRLHVRALSAPLARVWCPCLWVVVRSDVMGSLVGLSPWLPCLGFPPVGRAPPAALDPLPLVRPVVPWGFGLSPLDRADSEPLGLESMENKRSHASTLIVDFACLELSCVDSCTAPLSTLSLTPLLEFPGRCTRAREGKCRGRGVRGESVCAHQCVEPMCSVQHAPRAHTHTSLTHRAYVLAHCCRSSLEPMRSYIATLLSQHSSSRC